MTSAHRIAYCGNFRPSHSTENHVKAAMESHGHQVVPWQEDTVDWALLPQMAEAEGVDFVMWTRTWNMPSKGVPFAVQLAALDGLHMAGVPTVGYHLDRWWGLDREHQVRDEPFFKTTLMCTADGGHDERWAEAGVRHRWFPPAVWGLEARLAGTFRPEFGHDVAFVGSWQQYHAEWGYRMQLVGWLRAQFSNADRLGMWPRQGQPIRGQDLADMYASAKVIVGDSCLAGGATRYWSDRIPETLGRGGFLIHPWVEGLDDHYTPDEHLVCYELGDFPTLRRLIDLYVNEPEERARIATAGRAHVLAHHTYEHRMGDLIDLLHTEGIVRSPDARSGDVVAIDRHHARARFRLREDSTDAGVVNEVWRLDTYAFDPAEIAGRVVVDVGANVGAFTLWAAAHGASMVWAVEPDPANMAALMENVGANDVPCPVQVDQRAVVGPKAQGDVWLNPAGANTSLVAFGADEQPGSFSARPVGLPELFADVRAVAGDLPIVMKVDCEGGEYLMFDDLPPGTLDRVERIVMEFHGPGLGVDAPPEDFGWMVAELAERGKVEIIGRPSVGGMLRWWRYGS